MKRLAALTLLAACGAEEPRGTADEVPITMGGEIAPAPGVYPFQGTWAQSVADCAAAPGEEGGRVVITTQSFLHGTQACDIASVQEDAGAVPAYRLTADCDDGGATDIALRVDGDRLSFLDGEGTVLQRCEPSAVDE